MNKPIDLLIILPAAIGDGIAHANIINYYRKTNQTIHLFARTSETVYDDYTDIAVFHDASQIQNFKYKSLLDVESLPVHRSVVYSTRAQKKIGGKRRNIFNWLLFDARINRDQFQNIYADIVPFAQALGIPESEAQDWTIEANRSVSEVAKVGIHVDASNPLRYIPTNIIKKTIEYLLSRNIPTRIYGQNQARLSEFRRDYPSVMYSPMHLDELKSSIAQLKLVIAPDSGIAHLASSLNTPLLAFYGPTLSSISGPIHYSHIIEKSFPCRPCDQTKACQFDNRCLNTIEFHEVRIHVDKILNSR